MPVPHTSPNIQRSLLRNDVYRQLRDEIIAGSIRPGEQLREADIERATGVSRTPVREAINRLRSDGFVDVLPQRGTRVRKIDPASLRGALVVARHVYESAVPSAVMRLSERDLALIRAHRDAVAADPSHEVELLWNGQSFAGVPGVFLRLQGNRTLLRAAKAIDLHFRWAIGADRRLAGLLAAGPELLDALVRACEERDPGGVAATLSEYWDEAVTPYLAALDREARQPDSICAPGGGSCDPASSRWLLREQVHAALLEAIARGQFTSGERLREDELIHWLGVSRTPLREALVTLEQVGLVESLPGRFTRVTRADPAALSDVFNAMSVFGALSMRLGVPNLTPADLAALDIAVEAVEAAARAGEVAPLLVATNEFLRTVTRATGNLTLAVIEERVLPRLFKRVEVDPPLDVAQLAAEVRVLREAIGVGDVDAAQDAIRVVYEPRVFSLPRLVGGG